MSWSDLERLLAEDGECVVPVPLSAPVPEPQPVPVGPVAAYLADPILDAWSLLHHTGAKHGNLYAARAYRALKDAVGAK